MIKHECKWIKWFGYDAITFGSHVFITKEAFDNKQLLKHEMVHVEQYRRMGNLRFIMQYIYYHFKFGYENNPLEIEAREGEK